MNDIDFNIMGINRVIHRIPNPDWHKDRIYYESEYNMVMVLDGKAEYKINNKKIPVEKNDIIIFCPGVARAGYADRRFPWEFITINFDMELNDTGKAFFDTDYILFKNCGTLARSRFYDIAYSWEGKKPLYKIKCKTIVSEVIYMLLRTILPDNTVPHADKLEVARTYIQANFRKKINVEDLAKRINLSPSYFRKLFTEAYNQSPKQYIVNLRINSAYDLLVSGEVNVGEAAFLSGFDDIYYFSTLFKRQTGLTPSQVLYIKEQKQAKDRY